MGVDLSKLYIIFGVAFIVIICGLFVLHRSSLTDRNQLWEISGKNKIFRTISIILNWIWGILLLPIIAISFTAGVATLMMTDSGTASKIGITLITLVTFMFWGIPISIVIVVIASFILRKKLKFNLSAAIQLIPIGYSLITFGLLILITKIG